MLFYKSVDCNCRILQLSVINRDHSIRRWGEKLKKKKKSFKIFSHVIILQNLRTIPTSVSFSSPLRRKTKDVHIDTSPREGRHLLSKDQLRQFHEYWCVWCQNWAWMDSTWWDRLPMWRLSEYLGYVSVPCRKCFSGGFVMRFLHLHPFTHLLPPSLFPWILAGKQTKRGFDRGNEISPGLFGHCQLGDWGLLPPTQ